jgi:hypothetical protein
MATAAAPVDGRSVSVERVFGRAFGVMKAAPLVVFGIAFLFGAVPGVLVNYFGAPLQAQLKAAAIKGDATSVLLMILVGLVLILVPMLLAMLVQGALVRAVIAHTTGERIDFRHSVGAGLSMALPLLGLTIIVGLGLVLGMILLIVPGIILYIMWSVAAPALVAERHGVFTALGRSRRLTKGARWKTFGILLLVWIVTLIVGSVQGVLLFRSAGSVAAIAAMAEQGMPLNVLLLSLVTTTIISSLTATVQTSLYLELRDWKDGPANERLEDVFA